LGESSIDFYGRLLSPALTARRVFARVDAVRHEVRGVKSFVLKPNGHFRGFRAGQHVNLIVEIGGVRHTRSYSPSNAPDDGRTVVLTVKRHPHGRVSGWLHDHLGVGDWVELGQAFGEFTQSDGAAAKLLFIAGGSGITPLASLLRDVLAQNLSADVVLLTYARSYSELIFAEELRALARTHESLRVRFAITRERALPGDLAGRFGPEHLDAIAPDASERQTFVCGPRTLIDDVRRLWKERQFRLLPKTETFAPPEATMTAGAFAQSSVVVTAARTAQRFSAMTGISLLVQAERAGLSPASGCRQGLCFTCACRKRSGTVRDLSTGAISTEPDEQIRLCVSEALSDVTLDL
jgi:ferredoxin-NADP reductase